MSEPPEIDTNKEKKNHWDRRSLSDNFMIIFIFAMSVFFLILCILTFSENADKGFKFLEMFGNGVRQLLELSSKIFIEVYHDSLKSTAEFIVLILEGIIAWIQSTSILIVYLYVIMIIVIIMLVFERDNLGTIYNAAYEPMNSAVKEIWTKFSNPKNLISYGMFIVLVTFVPQIPEAIKTVVLKGQKLN